MSHQTTAIDLFAGAGGFSTGARQAGVRVVWAANHWQAAVDIHAVNHPDTEHACQDLCQANFGEVPDHDLLLASPSCQGHSKARGKERAHHDSARSTAWAVIACADVKRPAKIIVENVAEFLKWEAFPAWRAALECFGYQVTTHIFNAADAGVPQSRERVFVTAGWEPIHIRPPDKPHVPAREFIDFSLSRNRWSLIRKPGRAQNTLDRIAHGRKQFGDMFLIAYYGNERGGRDLDQPIGTITCKDRFAIVHGRYMRMLNVEEYRTAMGFPKRYLLPSKRADAVKMLGNAVPPPLARHVIREALAA